MSLQKSMRWNKLNLDVMILIWEKEQTLKRKRHKSILIENIFMIRERKRKFMTISKYMPYWKDIVFAGYEVILQFIFFKSYGTIISLSKDIITLFYDICSYSIFKAVIKLSECWNSCSQLCIIKKGIQSSSIILHELDYHQL